MSEPLKGNVEMQVGGPAADVAGDITDNFSNSAPNDPCVGCIVKAFVQGFGEGFVVGAVVGFGIGFLLAAVSAPAWVPIALAAAGGALLLKGVYDLASTAKGRSPEAVARDAGRLLGGVTGGGIGGTAGGGAAKALSGLPPPSFGALQPAYAGSAGGFAPAAAVPAIGPAAAAGATAGAGSGAITGVAMMTGDNTGGGNNEGNGNSNQGTGSGKTSDLPETTEASVADKLDRYLLNPDHPVGGPKAKWFQEALGFTKDNAADLAKQIQFDESKATETAVTQHGTKFNQVIPIEGANGKVIDVNFAWIKNQDGVVRLVTAIPTKK